MKGAAWSMGVAWGALATALASQPATANAPPSDPTPSVAQTPFVEDDLLWMEVRADALELTDSLNVYASRQGVYAPLGELSRVLDLAVGVFPIQGRAEGWILSPDRTVSLDLNSRTANLDGRVVGFSPLQAVVHGDDIYVRTDLLEQLLPIRIRADASAQTMEIAPTEPLPFQQRLARAQRRAALERQTTEGVAAGWIDTPYRLFTPPAFDVNVGGQAAREGTDRSRRFDIRASGDLLHAGLEAYVGSDDDGRVRDVRLSLTRKDPKGRALGPLGGTRVEAGDVYAPAMAIGAAGLDGRGFVYSSASLDSRDLATPLNLHGELAVGEEVELYVNEVLRGARTTPVQGRYEFLDVPLTYGLNTLRLVFYGPHGQTREEVKRINFGAGQLAKGETAIRLGLLQQGRALIATGAPTWGAAAGATRLTAVIDHGVGAGLTLSAGVARYSPEGQPTRDLLAFGARAALGPVAVQADLAQDDQDGRGLTLAAAARPFDMGLTLRHSEYAGGFVDETRQLRANGSALLTRASDIRLDGRFAGGGLSIPFTVNVARQDRADDSRRISAEFRASTALGPYYVSNAVVLEDDRGEAFRYRRVLNSTDITTVVAARTQLRAGAAYDLNGGRLESAYVTADIPLSEANALRFGAVKALDTGETTLQASAIRRMGDVDVALNAAYETRSGEWRFGVQLGFSLGFDPFRRRYVVERSRAASGGAVAVDAWVDDNGDGRRQAGEEPVSGLVAATAGGAAITDAQGRLRQGGLGDGARTEVRFDASDVEDPFLIDGAPVVAFTPRPGRTTVIDRPMRRAAEVMLDAALERPSGPRPLAALGLRLIPVGGGEPLAARSDHAGVVFFEGVPPGDYDISLDPDQERVLGLAMTRPMRLVVPASGGFVKGDPVVVRLTKDIR